MIIGDKSALPYSPMTTSALLDRHDQLTRESRDLLATRDVSMSQLVVVADLQDEALRVLRAHWLRIRVAS